MSSPEIAVARLGADLKIPASLFPGGMMTSDQVNAAIQTAIGGLTVASIGGLSEALAGSTSNTYDLIPRAGFTNGVQPRNHMITGAVLPTAPGVCVVTFHTIGQASPPPAMIAGDFWEDVPV